MVVHIFVLFKAFSNNIVAEVSKGNVRLLVVLFQDFGKSLTGVRNR